MPNLGPTELIICLVLLMPIVLILVLVFVLATRKGGK